MNKTTKQSVWTVPPEIKDAVQAMEKLEKGVSTKNATPAERKELARILAEVQDATKRKAEEPVAPTPSKKAKVEDAPDEEGEEEDESDDESEEEVEDWEKEAAAQLAKEAEIERAKKEEEARLAKQKAKEEATKEKAVRESLPEMSLDEAKAMFKVCSLGRFIHLV
jgi:transcription elongation regulator 1